ncbi:malonate decarboxylase subunit alpha [Rhodobacter capsulatus]|uniref:Malonate decarboxylase, alpha subunit n=1 Tax=Rhodobacter capsulatus (strain ATCC BAA-309 / NBRC 16581 / SB1003) TaxID=272942 RepID=D5AVQ0_RHOCB|nr:malonate decarboxylase subunit alpha [Rhodobacter capsulatus]ADE87385.1 malonate decarboxylase, alpha subunit [Rhodobacter capsulatus SB 1003]ETE52135.1 malonate decarboxylase subunit alpha [Rhodobacter capsulatus Y262]MDS0927602.1 malonate decarboxylase subunit alpha [Rhodobacter capsulatus]
MTQQDKRNSWRKRAEDTAARKEAAAPLYVKGKEVLAKDTVALLEAVIRPFDIINIEGNNQKQADFLAECLNKVDRGKIHDLHMVQSAVPLPAHLDLFENGIAKKLDFAFGGPQAGRVAKFIANGKIELGAIHTYLELFGRYFLDLTPRVSLVCAYKADRKGNLYTGFNTEDTPAIVEATKFREGIVIAQVNEIVDELPRVDIPGDWVDAVIQSPKPFFIEPLFTRDPALVTDSQILLAMMCLKGIYAEYGVSSMNHGIGFLTSAIELILPTYGLELGLKGKCCTHMILNPHPTMIPAIEEGWVDTIHCFGGELGMEDYVASRPDVFFVGPDGSLRSNRAFAQTAGHYAIDMFIGGTLQIDKYGNSSTATAGRVAGFGGAPNMGCDAKGRRHPTDAWLKCGQELPSLERDIGNLPRGKRLVVQGVETFGEGRAPVFVDELDAWKLARDADLPIPPVMIYGDDLTHIVTEEGIAYLNRCKDMEARMAAIRAVAGFTDIGLAAKPEETRALREAGIVKTVSDLGINPARANRDLLAAKSMRDLVTWSGGLYNPPARFRNW